MSSKLKILLAVFVAVAIGYSLIIPLFEGPDEDDHFRYAKFIADQRALPVQLFEPGGGIAGHQGWQPPLVYALAALVIAPIDTLDYEQHLWRNYAGTFVGDPSCCGRNIYYHTDAENFPYTRTTLAVHLARLISILFGAVTIYAAYALARELFTDNEWLALAIASVVAFNPSFLFASALVSNDAPLAAFSALALLMWARLLNGRVALNAKTAALTGLILGFAILTKTTALGLVPLTMLVLLFLAWRARDLRLGITTNVILVAVFALIAGWWFVRNWILYGDPLAARLVSVSALFPRSGELTPPELFQISLPWMWQTFWGGPTPGDFSPIILSALAILTAIALIGFTIFFFRIPNYKLRITIFFLVAWFVVIFVAQLRFITMTTGADQGRYLFPAIPVIALIIVLGLDTLMQSTLRTTHLSHLPWRAVPGFVICSFVIFASFALALFVPFAYTLPAYARPTRASENDLTRITNPIRVNFANQIELLGYDLDGRAVKPGDTLRIALYWRALAPMSESFRVFVHLVGQGDTSAGGTDVIPARGAFPTVYWKPGDALRDVVNVPVIANATPGKYALEVGLYPIGKPGERLTAIETGDDRALIAAIKIAPREQIAFAPRTRADVRFGDAIELAGYDAEVTQDKTHLVLYWRARGAVEQDYTVFAHAFDVNGKRIGQVDQQPQAGNYPTSIWSAGEMIRDEIVLPKAARVIVGLYRADTGERLITPNGDAFELNLAGSSK